MEYKGYLASISYDDITDMLHGHVVNSGSYPICTFMAHDVEGLKREFKVSVDEYLAGCEEDGVEPIKPYSGEINLRLGPKLHHTVTLLAIEDETNPHDWIMQTVEERVWKLANPGKPGKW